MAEGEKKKPFGRGGRGAALLAALEDPARKPGLQLEKLTLQSPESQDSSQAPRPLGRAALLSQHLQQHASPGRAQLLGIVPLGRAGRASRTLDSSALPSSSTPSGRGTLIHQPPSSQAIPGRGAALISTLQATGGRGAPLNQPLPSSSQPEPISLISLPSSPLESRQVQPAEPKEPPSVKYYRGNQGKPINMSVNYLRLKTTPNMGVFEYHIDFNPPIDSKNIRFRIINQQEMTNLIGKVKLFDGFKLYLPLQLPEKVSNKVIPHPLTGESVNLTIKFVGKAGPHDHIHLFNILFRRIMYVLKMNQIQRHYFDPQGAINIPQHRLSIWPGYVTAIQEYEDGMMLNCDCSFKVLRNITALEIIHEDMNTQGPRFKQACMSHLLGEVVMTQYNNKTYRIDDINWDMTPLSTFTDGKGNATTFREYYRTKYDIHIQDENQPILVNKPKAKPNQPADESRYVGLIPELCYMTGLTDSMRQDFRIMKDIATHTRVTPNQRMLSLKNFINNIKNNAQAKEILANWGLYIEDASISLEGLLLPNEKIITQSESFYTSKEADWSRNLSQGKLLSAVNLDNWAVIVTKRDNLKANDFISMMMKVGPSLGMQVTCPGLFCINDDRTDTYIKELRKRINSLLQIVVVIFPAPREDRYNAVKKLCCIEMPIPSQVINSRTISQMPKLRSVTQKVAMQINCKLGGELWALDIPLQNIMVLGLDTYHDAGRGKARSVLAFVASLNRTLTRWFSQTSFQAPNQEEGITLRILLLNALRKYIQVNNSLPDKIFMYRDGVGDGRFDFILAHELPQMLTAFEDFDNYHPHFSFIVVQKKINTRMFLELNGRGQYDNPPPGSVVDHTVTRRYWRDFFLVSQHVRQGTVSPTHYVILYDTSNRNPSQMQRLAYKLTHLYYNWPGTVRVPAPCQYAHKLAYLAGQNLHNKASDHLADKLFYL